MKKQLHILLFLTILMGTYSFSNAQVFYTLDFEAAGGYTTSHLECTDGSEDYFTRSDGSNLATGVVYNAPQGSFFFAAQDIDGGPCGPTGSSPKSLLIDDVNIAGKTGLELTIALAEDDDGGNQDWDDADAVFIEYDIDNSGTFTTLLRFESDCGTSCFNGEPALDTDNDGTGDGPALTDVFQDFMGSIAGTGGLIDIRIRFEGLTSGDEDVAIDNIRLSSIVTGPTVGFDNTTSGDNEGNTVLIPVTLANGASFPVTLSVTPTNITAEGGDYTLNTTSLTFNADGTQNVSVTLNSDVDSDDEIVDFTLAETTLTGVTIGTATNTLTITDVNPTIGFDNTTSTDNEGNTVLIPVTLTNGVTFPVTMSVTPTNLTAEGGDYTINTTSLTFNADGTQNVSVTLNQDFDIDDETVDFTLAETTSTSVTLATATNTLTITDDDVIPNNVTSLTIECTTGSTATLSWTTPVGIHDGIVILGREAAAPTGPGGSDDESALAAANADFSAATDAWGSAAKGKVLYNGNGTSATITGLTPGVSYTFKAYTYTWNTNTLWSSGTQRSATATLDDVTGAAASGSSPSSIQAFWTNIAAGCFDEVLVVVNETAGIGFTPTGDGSAYTANSTYAAPDQVVYKGSGTSVNVSGLSAGVTYYFEIFVRKGTEWSSGVEVNAVLGPILAVGDLVITGFDNNVGSAVDRISLVTMVPLEPGTQFYLANMVYEMFAPANVRTDRWYSCNGSADGNLASYLITYTGGGALAAGSVICLELPTSGNITVFEVNGAASPDFTGTQAGGGGTTNFSTTRPDAVFLMQGTWTSHGSHQTFAGNVLGGIQDGATWYDITDDLTSIPSGDNRRRSRIPPQIECFNIQGRTSTGLSFAYYNGIKTGSKIGLLGNITNFANWNTGTGTGGNDIPSTVCTDIFTITGTTSEGVWTGATDTDWFNCHNWENLQVPDATVNVTVDAANSSNNCVVDRTSINAAPYNNIAVCNDLTINDERVHLVNADDTLEANGNLLIENGAANLDLDGATTDGHFILHGNWENQADRNAFTQGNSHVTFAGNGTQTITTADGGGVEDFGSIDVSKSGGELVVGCTQITVDDDMDFQNGIVQTTATQKVLFDVDATASNASDNSHISGPVVKETSNSAVTTFAFPTGKLGHLGTMEIETRMFLGEFFEAEYFHNPYVDIVNVNTAELNHVSQKEYWTLDDLGNLGEHAKVTLHWTPFSYVVVVNDLRVAHYESIVWNREGNAPVVAGGSTVANGALTSDWVTSFSPFTLGDVNWNGGSLPIKLVSFDAQKVEKEAHLSWAVESEELGTLYHLERSSNGIDFELLTTEKALGNLTTTNYGWIDESPLPGINYYRLRAVEISGDETFSEVKTLTFDRVSGEIVIYPNPTFNDVTIEFPELLKEQATLEVMDVLGRKVIETTLAQKLNKFTLNTDELAAGTYILKIKLDDATTIVQKFEKLK
ncbi:MAG: T9SS type A sorting domain-containing protein [Aureispira sp.]|nr:T9SS type A sorting domain-containing protein [Aureispira sp.]